MSITLGKHSLLRWADRWAVFGCGWAVFGFAQRLCLPGNIGTVRSFLVAGPIGGPMHWLCVSPLTSSSATGPIDGLRARLCFPGFLCSFRATRGPGRSVGRCCQLKTAYNTKGLPAGPVSASTLVQIRLVARRGAKFV